MIVSVGKFTVPAPGTPVSITTTLIRGTGQPCHGLMFQALPANVGSVVIGNQNMNRSALTNCYAVLGKPTTNSDGDVVSLPTFSVADTIVLAGLLLSSFYIDAANAGDGVLVTALVN